MEQIPVFQQSSSNFTQEIILGGLNISLNIYWNSRSDAWYMNLSDGIVNLYGIKIVPNWLLLKQYKYKFPDIDGDIICLKVDDTAPDRLDYNSLGDTYQLFIADSTETELWEDTYGLG